MRKVLFVLVLLLSSANAENIYATFNILPAKSADLAFNASGVVETLYVDINSKVKKGQKLAQLQSDELRASLQIAKSSLADTKVALDFAARDYEREQKVQHLVDEATFDRVRLAYERARVAVLAAEANVKFKQTQLNNSTLYAPFAGVITDKKLEVGDVVNSMAIKTVFSLQSLSSRKLIVEFDQANWNKVRVGDSFKYKVDGDIKEHMGKISKIYPASSATNRKMKAEVLANDLIVGLYGDGTIVTK